MIMRLILWLSVLWIAPLVSGVLVNDAKFKKNLAVGVTIPPEFQADPDIAAHLARFRRQEWTLCVILAAAAIPCIFVRDFGQNMTLWSVWLLLVCVLPYAPYARCNLALKRLKAERGWRRETAPCTETVDLSAISSYRWLSPWLFALPFVVSLCRCFERGELDRAADGRGLRRPVLVLLPLLLPEKERARRRKCGTGQGAQSGAAAPLGPSLARERVDDGGIESDVFIG